VFSLVGWCRIDPVVIRSESEVPDGELLTAVADRYGLRVPVTGRRLTGGYANDVFRIDFVGGSAVVHVKHPPVDAASIAWEHEVVTALADWLPPALPPLPALDGSTWFWHEGRPVWLVAFAPGAPAAVHDRDAVAAVLGRLHAAPVEVPPRPGHGRQLTLPLPPVRGLPEEFARQHRHLLRARDELTDLLNWIQQERRPITGLTHNDIFEGNVLVEQGRVTALLDWEEANLDWLVWDVASSLWPFCSVGDRLDTDATSAFLRAYRAAGGPVPPHEDDLIVPLVRAKRLLEVLRAPTDRHPRWSLQRANLRAYSALISAGLPSRHGRPAADPL
jgi:Ser/Thr protein kinase RdoA (MazF antagonist)